MVTIISHRPLSGDYGAFPAGHVFDVDDKTAESLERRGLASRYRRPPSAKDILAKMQPAYENKAMDTTEEIKSFLSGNPSSTFTFRRPGRPRKNP
jgi:hypothetical protein